MSEERPMRDYAHAPKHVVDFYRENHAKQTLAFVLQKKAEYYPLNRLKMGMWEMLELLDQFRDDSDPDTELSQMQHALQAAEAARKRWPTQDWFILAALIHDAGKILGLPKSAGGFGEPQWAVVGDTFPVGCQYSTKNVFPEFFAYNTDSEIEHYQTELGIYRRHCGLDSVHFSWGHDEYLYQVLNAARKSTEPHCLPPTALAIVRYHSAYVIHQAGGYPHLGCDDRLLEWVRDFQKCDLYSKAAAPVDVAEVRPYYQELIAKYLPEKLSW